MSISAALKRARRRKGLSQRALGARVHIPQSHISKIESGAVDPQLSTLLELARSLELDLRLVPRSALPAVDAVIRATISGPEDAPRPAFRLDDEDDEEDEDG